MPAMVHGDARLSRFTAALRDLCAAHILDEKWLVAPSRRVGRQWLDAVTLSGQPVLNARLTTTSHLALELAAPELEREGLRVLRGAAHDLLIGRLWEAVRGSGGGGYLRRLPVSRGLLEALSATVRDLRLAGVEASTFGARSCESSLKGEELAELLGSYERSLDEERLADLAFVLRVAARRLRAGALREGALIVAPEAAGDERALELELWDAIPRGALHRLPTDQPGNGAAARVGGLFRAVGEANELREVLRRCVAGRIPLDEVEILHTDPGVYPALAFELACAKDPESPRLTIAEGLPVRTFRPGRALLGWVEWARGGFPQTVLARMVQDGLVELPLGDGLSFARLAALLRAAPIGVGSERYLPGLRRAIAAARDACRDTVDDPDHPERSRAARLRSRKRLRGLEQLASLAGRLLAAAPRPESTGAEILAAAAAFVGAETRAASELDGYARRRLLRAIEEQRQPPPEAAEVWDWLARLPLEAHVGGEGPRPGCLHLAGIHAGGHSGRPHTFIIGLDDSRFPGAGLQDPILLDEERRAVSAALPTAAARAAARRLAVESLLARLRGTVTLSYPFRSLVDDRELQPSGAIVGVYRSLTGDLDGDQAAFEAHLGPPAAFAPEAVERCTDLTEWWLWRFCAGPSRIVRPEEVVAQSFPSLGRGLVARRERASDRFTAYDGYVPEAGLDLSAADAPVVSASRLEKLATCPLEYFFHYVLGLELPEEHGASDEEWLGALGRGSVLHEVFCLLMRELTGAGLKADYQRDSSRLCAILDERIALRRRDLPPPNEEVFRREVEEMRRTAHIFLHEEQAQARAGRTSPFCFEVAVGMSADGRGTPLDRKEALPIPLPGGGSVRVRGRIDRIDQLIDDPARFAVWDYKTGSAWKYDEGAPFRGGRRVQGAIYLAMASAVLRDAVSPRARASSFGYFFPAGREHGRRVAWSDRGLEAGPEVLKNLRDLLRAGAFPFSDLAEDASFSDYRSAFGDVEASAAATRAKLARPANAALESFRELRRHD